MLISQLFFFGLAVSFAQSPTKAIYFNSLDSLKITADLYLTANSQAPLFITSAKSEEEGFHGSKALWKENEGNENYWKAVERFLKNLK